MEKDCGENTFTKNVFIKHTGKKGRGLLVNRGSSTIENCKVQSVHQNSFEVVLRAKVSFRGNEIISSGSNGIACVGNVQVNIEKTSFLATRYPLAWDLDQESLSEQLHLLVLAPLRENGFHPTR